MRSHPQKSQSISPSSPDLLPVELIFAIYSYLDATSLKMLSLVSKRHNELTSPRLWRSYRISDSTVFRDSSSTSLHWNRALTDMCNAITRNPQRAACIRQLTINIVGSPVLWTLWGSSVMRAICQALCVTKSLETLVAHFPDKEAGRGIAAMASMLSFQPFTFRLIELECDSLMEPEIFTFLARQQKIERYSVRKPSRPHAHGAEQRQRADSSPSGASPVEILPSLQHFTGPSSHIRQILGRKHMESVQVYCDSGSAQAFELAAMTHAWTETSRVSTTRLAHAKKLTLSRGWSLDRESYLDFAAVVEQVYGILPQSIRHLRFEYFIIREVDVPHNFDLLRPEHFARFTNLEKVEWNCCFFGECQNDLRGDRARVHGSRLNEDRFKRLVRQCEASYPSLRHLSITRMSAPVLGLRWEEERGERADVSDEENSIVLRLSKSHQWVLAIYASSLRGCYRE